MSDPVTSAAVAAAKFVGEKAISYLAMKVYEGSPCASPEQLTAIPKLFCMAVRGAAGVDEKEYRQHLTQQIDLIAERLGRVEQAVSSINQNVTRLLQEMNLVHLEIAEALVGQSAFSALQQIRSLYRNYSGRIASAGSGADELTVFFKDILQTSRLHLQTAVIVDALVNPFAGKPGLLQNVLGQIAIKGSGKGLAACYELYETYTRALVLDLLKGQQLVEAAIGYLQILAEERKLPELKAGLPYSAAGWQAECERQRQSVADAFHLQLDGFVLKRDLDKASGLNPYFLSSEARGVFMQADLFSARLCQRYGIHGRIFSMGERFDGTLKLDADTFPARARATIPLDEPLDYWSATTPGVYDCVAFANAFVVHRYRIPLTQAGTRKITSALPYSPADIETVDLGQAATGWFEETPAAGSAPAIFGSFIEMARAGGSFAFLSGEWEQGRRDQDSSNPRTDGNDSYPQGVAQVAELHRMEVTSLREDRRMLGSVRQPEVGLSKGGKVIHALSARGDPDFHPELPEGRDQSHWRGAYATWWQTRKTITLPMPPEGQTLELHAALTPQLQADSALADAATLNGWLKGSWGRPLQPSSSISDAELLGKPVIVGVNYDPSLAFPDQGCSLTAGISLYPVFAEGPASHKDSPHTGTDDHAIALGNASCLPKYRGVFREQASTQPRQLRAFLSDLYQPYGTRLKFRFEAYYRFAIETSGLDDTPFAMYARGRLENACFRLAPAGNALPPGIYFDLKDPADLGFAYDYDGTGRPDHLVLYRPGSGRILISRHLGSNEFRPVGPRGPEGIGIGGFDLKVAGDRIFPFDHAGSGHADHLLAYRPGNGAVSILKRNGGVFEAVFSEPVGGKGIGGFNLDNPADQGFAFDYDSSGKLDHLVFYRPGRGALFIIRHDDKGFSPVYAQGAPGKGIGGFDLSGAQDKVFAYDHDGRGRMDHLVLYRPGAGRISILKRQGSSFVAVYQRDSGGIGGYDLANPADLGFAFDFDGKGSNDHLVFYRPGKGAIFILKPSDGDFKAVYRQGDGGGGGGGGGGIGQYDLRHPADRVFPFDYRGNGLADHLVLYRPGTGVLQIIRNNSGAFVRIYAKP